MPVPDQEYVQPILISYEARIVEVIFRAWKAWWDRKTGFNFKRTRACGVHELIVREARKEFGGDSKVHIIDGPETIYLLIESKIVVRIKKGNRRGLGSNNPTQASLALENALETESLPLGLPEVGCVDVTYILNDLETRIDHVMVVAREGAKKMWGYPIYPRAAGVVTEFPSKPKPAVTPDNVVRVPTKRDKRDEETAE